MAIDIRRTKDTGGSVLLTISDAEWDVMQVALADLLDQWGEFIGPYVDGKLTGEHCKQIALRLEAFSDVSETTKAFFRRHQYLTGALYTSGD